MEMFCILIQMVDTQVYIHVKIHHACPFMISALYWVYLIPQLKRRAINK